MSSFLGRLAKYLYRRPEEARAASAPEVIRVKDALFYAALTVLVIGIMPFIARVVFQKNFDHVEVEVPLSNWHVLYSASPPCSLDARKDATCFANPSNSKLWNSIDTRDQAKHRAETSKLRNKEFWVGATIPSEVLTSAAALTANHFIVGWIRGTYRMWFDGDFIVGGKWSDNEPLALPVTLGRLRSGSPLHIAIEIINDSELQGSPDAFARGMGTGFATKKTEAAWRRAQGIVFSSRPLALFISNLLLAVIFLLIWSFSREKQEYFYIALYAFASTLVQLRSVDSFYLSVSRSTLDVYSFLAASYYAGLSMFVGFAFARMRPAVFRWGIPATLSLPVLAVLLVRDPIERQNLFWMFYHVVGPCAATIGALSCFIQSWLLRNQRSEGAALPVREKRLMFFGGMLLVIALNCALDQGLPQSQLRSFLHQTGNVFFLLVLGLVALRDYHEERLLMLKAPVSPYHRRALIPEAVHGAVLAVDLKDSERLFRIGSGLRRGAELVDICISHLAEVAAEHKGVVILSKGAMIRVFFDSVEHESPALAAIRASDAMMQRLRALEKQLPAQFVIKQELKLEFRAAIAVGSIRPVWHELGTIRYAGWAAAGEENIFTESLRLLDLDHYLPTRSRTVESRLVLTERLAATLCEARHELAERFTARNLILKGEHNREYCVAFYLPSVGGGREFKRVA